jgi:oligosaccharide translocation protein RFT1
MRRRITELGTRLVGGGSDQHRQHHRGKGGGAVDKKGGETDKDNDVVAATSSEGDSKLSQSFMKNTSYLVILQIVSRLLTHATQHVLFHRFMISPQTYGIVYIHLEFLYSCILFLGREALRLTAMHKENQRQLLVDRNNLLRLGSLALPIGFIASVVLYGLFVYPYRASYRASFAYYDLSWFVYLCSAYLELGAEPAFLLMQHAYRLDIKMKVECLAAIIRSLVILVFLTGYLGRYEYASIPLACGQLSYSAIILIAYNLAGSRLIGSKLPLISLVPGWSWLSISCRYYLRLFTWQSIIKLALTENDRIVLSYLSSFYDQGMYAFISNYGSLLVRLILQPLEESSHILFSKLSPSMAMEQASHMVRFVTYLGGFFIAFGSNYTYVISEILIRGGEASWNKSLASELLSLYCFYILILGINGITESYLSAVVGKREVSLINYLMFLIAAIHYGTSYLFVPRWGAVGLIYANGISMACRIVRSVWFLERYRGTSPVPRSAFLPSPIVVICLSISWWICHSSIPETITSGNLTRHLLYGFLLASMTCLVLYHRERNLWKAIRGHRRAK